jgi:hypothetical protein
MLEYDSTGSSLTPAETCSGDINGPLLWRGKGGEKGKASHKYPAATSTSDNSADD